MTKKSKSLVKKIKQKYEKKDKISGFMVLDCDSHCYTTQELHDDKSVFNIYLSSDVSYQHHYHRLMNFLRARSKDDLINLYVNNHGGSVHTGLQLIHAIRDSKAHIKAIVDGAVYSMAPIIVLACKDIELRPHAMLMFHDYKAMVFGSGQEILKITEATRKLTTAMLMDACHPFLSKAEIKSIASGEDIYVHYDEAVDRLKKHMKDK